MAKKVRVLNSSMIPPALPTPSDPIWLSNLDLLSARVHVPLVFFFRNKHSSPQPIPSPASSIKDSLARILVPYYPFAGRFGKSPDGRREIKCTGEGVLFFEAVSDLTLDEFAIYNNSFKNYSLLIPPTNELNIDDDVDKIPILLFQLTTFRCGGLCLGTAMNHQAADGIAALRFICNWAAATRDPTQPIPTPSFDRTSLRPRSPPSVQFPHPEFDFREGAEKEMILSSFIYLDLAPVQVAAIKDLGGGKYSSFESIAAYIWRCVCRVRGSAGPDEERRLLTVADMRRRVGYLFPDEFVGNAIMLTVAIVPLREVVAGALPVGRIREAIENLTEEYLKSAIDLIELPEDEGRVSRFSGNFAAMDISVTNWSKLALYEVDFGWGLPEFVVPTGQIPPGHFLVLPSLGGGVKIACSLEAEKMEDFVKLFHELLPIVTGKESDV